jgi:hypothetical protein
MQSCMFRDSKCDFEVKSESRNPGILSFGKKEVNFFEERYRIICTCCIFISDMFYLIFGVLCVLVILGLSLGTWPVPSLL